MGKRPKPGGGQPAAFATPLDPTACRVRIQSFLSGGKTRDALDLAKQLFKATRGPDAESLVLDAYEAHLRALLARRMYPEARHLASTVIERFRGARDRFVPLVRLAEVASTGDTRSLVAELASADGPRRRELEAILARELRDPQAIAASPALREDDPLKRAAGTVCALLAAATTAPVSRDALAPLSAIPRHSPLAPWRLLIRAIAAFYRREDGAALANLSAIPADSGPAPLAAALRSLLTGAAPGHDPGCPPEMSALIDGVSGGRARPRWHAARLVQALAAKDASRAAVALQDLLPHLRSCPPSVRQTALVTILHHWSQLNLDPGPLLRALLRGRPDAETLRLVALTFERRGAWPDALLAWDRYLDVAVRSGALPAAGPEVARVLLHMAGLFPPDPEDVLDEFDVESEEELRAQAQRGALPACADRGLLLERARAADPFPGVFRALVEHYDKRDPRRAEIEAEAWHRAHPRDLEPLLYLIRAAERRGALRKALRLLAQAETIDPVHFEVRRSRFRLLLAGTEHRIKEGRPALAERDLERLAREPAAGEGETAVYVAGLRWAVARRRADAAGGAEIEQALAARTGNPTLVHLVLSTIALSLGVDAPVPAPRPSQAQAVEALARACELFRRLDRPLRVSPELAARVEQDMSTASATHLHALCAGGLAMGRPSLAYVAAGEGLARDDGARHRFLLARGRALRMAVTHREHHERAGRCLRAARELAARARDMEAVRETSAALAQLDAEASPFGLRGRPSPDDAPPTQEEIVRIVAAERSARDMPRFAAGSQPRRAPRRGRPRQQSLFEDVLAFLEQTL